MASILRSIKPYNLYLILTGKELLISKDKPIDKDWDELVYLYCTKDIKSFLKIPVGERRKVQKYLGMIAGHFFCAKIEDIHQFILEPRNKYERGFLDSVLEKSGLSYDELCAYMEGRDYHKKFYLWDCSCFVKCKPTELKAWNIKKPPQSWQYID